MSASAAKTKKKKGTVTLPRGIRQRENGSFLVDVTKNGVRKTAVARTLEAALTLHAQMQADAQDGKGLHTADTTAPREAKAWTLKDAFDRTLASVWSGLSSEKTATINSKTALDFLGADTLLQDIGPDDIDNYLTFLSASNIADGTINRKLSVLSRMFRTAYERRAIPFMPKIPRRKEKVGRIRFLTPDEETRLLKWFLHIGKQDHYEASIILVDTGFRTGELWRVEAQHIDFVQGTYGAIILWKTKNNKPRTIPMTHRVREIITRRVREYPEGPLFPEGGKDWFRNGWDKVRTLMNMEDDPEFVPHTLRHTCCSRLVQRGVPLVHVQKWMGHSSIQTTMRYAHLAPQDLFSAMSVLEGGEHARWGVERVATTTSSNRRNRKNTPLQ